MVWQDLDWRRKREQHEELLAGREFNRVMMPLEDALTLLLAHGKLSDDCQEEMVALWEAGGRVLAEDAYAKEPVPPFDRSPLDGYALRAEDTFEASFDLPCHLKIIEEVPAGYVARQTITKGTAIKVLTGAPLPTGANAVIRFEEVEQDGELISIARKLQPGEGVAPLGEDIPGGEKVLTKGQVIGPAHLGLLATLGVDPVLVRKIPKVGIFSTGDELVSVQGDLPPGKIRVSNLYPLAELVRQAGGCPVNLGILPDRQDAVEQAFRRAEEMGLDLVVSTGGVSAGDYDVVKDAMKAAGAGYLFWKVAIRPGAPVAAAEKNGKIWLGLSGSPSGALLIGLLLVAPLVAHMAGKRWNWLQRLGQLTVPIHREKGLRGFWWARMRKEDGKIMVEPLREQRCGVMKSYLNSNALIEIPAGSVQWSKGTSVPVWIIPNLQGNLL